MLQNMLALEESLGDAENLKNYLRTDVFIEKMKFYENSVDRVRELEEMT